MLAAMEVRINRGVITLVFPKSGHNPSEDVQRKQCSADSSSISTYDVVQLDMFKL